MLERLKRIPARVKTEAKIICSQGKSLGGDLKTVSKSVETSIIKTVKERKRLLVASAIMTAGLTAGSAFGVNQLVDNKTEGKTPTPSEATATPRPTEATGTTPKPTLAVQTPTMLPGGNCLKATQIGPWGPNDDIKIDSSHGVTQLNVWFPQTNGHEPEYVIVLNGPTVELTDTAGTAWKWSECKNESFVQKKFTDPHIEERKQNGEDIVFSSLDTLTQKHSDKVKKLD